jgi:hypothetical protein
LAEYDRKPIRRWARERRTSRKSIKPATSEKLLLSMLKIAESEANSVELGCGQVQTCCGWMGLMLL